MCRQGLNFESGSAEIAELYTAGQIYYRYCMLRMQFDREASTTNDVAMYFALRHYSGNRIL